LHCGLNDDTSAGKYVHALRLVIIGGLFLVVCMAVTARMMVNLQFLRREFDVSPLDLLHIMIGKSLVNTPTIITHMEVNGYKF
jgi:hypothetical protein